MLKGREGGRGGWSGEGGRRGGGSHSMDAFGRQGTRTDKFVYQAENGRHVSVPKFFHAPAKAHPPKDKWISSPSHFSSFFTV